MDKSEVVRILEEMASILEIAEANRFEVLAYRNGAQNLADWEGDLGAAVSDGSLREIHGIGKRLARVISDLVLQGRSEEHDRLRGLYPDTLLDLLAVSGLGPKTIRMLYEQLGVDGLDGLEAAAKEQKIRNLKGFGARSEERILARVERARRHGRR